MSAIDLSILWPAFIAGLLVTATHVPLGMQVLARGIVFIDLAIAQIAGLGVLVADRLGFEAQGIAVQASALIAALVGAAILTWTERRWPDVQEAIIGVAFVLAATGSILLLASNVHGGEHLRDLLAGQVLWVRPGELGWAAAVYAAVLVAWFASAPRLGRAGFYAIFACAVTVSVQLVGIYLVFATLIVPALATRDLAARRLVVAWTVGVLGYAAGLVLSTSLDLPSGPMIVWTLVGIGLIAYGLATPSRRKEGAHSPEEVRSHRPQTPSRR